MTFSYNQPSGGVFPTVKDEIRYLIGDRTQSDFSISDEEIAYLIKFFDNLTYSAASKAAETIAIEYAKQANSSRSVGDLSLSTSYQSTADHYMRLSKSLLEGPGSTYHQTYFVALSDQNVSSPLFTLGQFDERRP
jgi:hypothetical protein